MMRCLIWPCSYMLARYAETTMELYFFQKTLKLILAVKMYSSVRENYGRSQASLHRPEALRNMIINYN